MRRAFFYMVVVMALSGCVTDHLLNEKPYGLIRGVFDGFVMLPKATIHLATYLLGLVSIPAGDVGPIVHEPNTGASYFTAFFLSLIGTAIGIAREIKNRGRSGSDQSKDGHSSPNN